MIFSRLLDYTTGLPHEASPVYAVGITNWPNGGTLYGSQLVEGVDSYDATGKPQPAALKEHLKNLIPGAVVAIDIESHGYNDPAHTAGANQIEMIIQCKHARPDCKFGYYGAFGDTVNALTLPPGSESRLILEGRMKKSESLAAFVDFLAPSIYAAYAGPIKDDDGKATPGMMRAFSDPWPNNSRYGFDEWSDYALWVIEMCKQFGKPVYPYFSPYTLQNGPQGQYQNGYLKYLCPWFAEGVRFILDHADGMFFFDQHVTRWDAPVEQEIIRILKANNA